MRNAAIFALIASIPSLPSLTFAWNVPTPKAEREQSIFGETGPFEIAIHASGNLAYTEVGDVKLYVPNVDMGGFIGTGLGRGLAIGYHGRFAIEPAETVQRHALSLALVRNDGSLLLDGGFGLFDGDFGKGTSVLFGLTLQAKLFGTGFSLVVPFYCDVTVDPFLSAWVTFGVGIGYSTL